MTTPEVPEANATERWADQSFLRDVQYRTDANLAARQSIYAYQHPRIDLPARVLDLALPEAAATIADIGCGNGAYLAELASRSFAGRVIGADLSVGMLAASRQRVSTAVGSADRVAVVAADATALPFRDGTADLTLAMHMLYHVPEPMLALREFWRVTRPGGHVIIGLNDADHLRELRDAIAVARRGDPAGSGSGAGSDRPDLREPVSLDDGEILARAVFSRVVRHDFAAELRVPAQEPIADYVRSMPGTKHSTDPGRLAAEVVGRLPRRADGLLTITTRAGCLICDV